jgi:hypothetical protein
MNLTSPVFTSHVSRRLIILLAATLLISIPCFASVDGSFDRSYQVNGPVDLEVLSHSGDITIHNGPSGTVAIHGKIHVSTLWFGGDHKSDVQAIEKNPPIQQNGNRIRVDYVNAHNISVDYEITVPQETAVRAHTGSGNLNVEGVRGRIELESGSGDMKLSRLTGEMRFQTGSGNVRGHELAGPMSIKAGSGDVDVQQTGQGDIEARTGSGNVTITGINGGFHADAGSGDIRGQGTPKSPWSVRTGSGNVKLELPSDAAFDADISTGSGNVTTNHAVTTTVEGRVPERHKSLIGKVRGGGPTVSVHTGSGNVQID